MIANLTNPSNPCTIEYWGGGSLVFNSEDDDGNDVFSYEEIYKGTVHGYTVSGKPYQYITLPTPEEIDYDYLVLKFAPHIYSTDGVELNPEDEYQAVLDSMKSDGAQSSSSYWKLPSTSSIEIRLYRSATNSCFSYNHGEGTYTDDSYYTVVDMLSSVVGRRDYFVLKRYKGDDFKGVSGIFPTFDVWVYGHFAVDTTGKYTVRSAYDTLDVYLYSEFIIRKSYIREFYIELSYKIYGVKNKITDVLRALPK